MNGEEAQVDPTCPIQSECLVRIEEIRPAATGTRAREETRPEKRPAA
jgi:hypothetical protein